MDATAYSLLLRIGSMNKVSFTQLGVLLMLRGVNRRELIIVADKTLGAEVQAKTVGLLYRDGISCDVGTSLDSIAKEGGPAADRVYNCRVGNACWDAKE